MLSPAIPRDAVDRCRNLRSRPLVLGLALAGAFGAAFAADDLLAAVGLKLDAHDAAGAYALLAEAESQRASDRRFDYLLGVSAESR